MFCVITETITKHKTNNVNMHSTTTIAQYEYIMYIEHRNTNININTT